MKNIMLQYETVNNCPLCGCKGKVRANISRPSYYFGEFCIPLPDSGVFLHECTNCSLLFKSSVPNKMDLMNVLSNTATEVWKPKQGIHPAVELVKPYFDGHKLRILDIGASNGDLLAQLAPYSCCLSAMDIFAYPKCKKIIDGEYIIGNIEEQLVWSGRGYDIVTAFDIFEHFLDAKSACLNISSLVCKGGRLIIETGDWSYYEGDLGSWYYANLFEHQIFWSNRSITYMCDEFGFKPLEYNRVQYKSLHNLALWKLLVLKVVLSLASFSWFRNAMLSIGKGDPSRFGQPTLRDHAFIVLEK